MVHQRSPRQGISGVLFLTQKCKSASFEIEKLHNLSKVRSSPEKNYLLDTSSMAFCNIVLVHNLPSYLRPTIDYDLPAQILVGMLMAIARLP
jgi:hypothetical protein